MTQRSDEATSASVAEAYRAKARAEIATADSVFAGSGAVPSSGEPLAGVLLVKGEPGPAELSGGAALSGADGEAAAKALVALGFESDSMFAAVSRPVGEASAESRIERLALLIEAVDPTAVVGLDAAAAEDIAAALEMPARKFGEVVRVSGRDVVCIDGLEASLTDPVRKRRVWTQLRSLSPAEPVW